MVGHLAGDEVLLRPWRDQNERYPEPVTVETAGNVSWIENRFDIVRLYRGWRGHVVVETAGFVIGQHENRFRPGRAGHQAIDKPLYIMCAALHIVLGMLVEPGVRSGFDQRNCRQSAGVQVSK